MNGDLGADAGTASLNLMAKASEALLEALKSLIKGLYQIYKDHPQRKLDAVALKEAKTTDEKLKIIKKMQGIDGFISAKKLEKYCNAIGANVIPRNMEFENQDQRDLFCKVAKEQHLMFSMTEDKNNPLKTTVLVADKDVELLKRCKEMTEDTLKVEIIDEKIESILGGRDYNQLTEAEKFKVDVLSAERASINDKWTNNFNQNTYSNVVDDIINASHGEKYYEADKIDFKYDTFTNDTYNKNNAFASALDSDVFKKLNKDRYSVVVSASDPNKYVVCHSYNNPNKNEAKKIVTRYEAFNADGNSQMFSDEGISAKDWVKMREEMQAFCKIGNENVLRFNSVKDFENWRKLTNEQNKNEEIRSMADSELKDGIEKRTEELKSNGFEIREDGEVYCISDGKKAKDVVVEINAELNNRKLTPLERVELEQTKADMKEGFLIGTEISTYNKLIKANDDMAILKSNLTIAEINNDDAKIESIKGEIDALTQYHDILTNDKENIVEQRKEVNSVQTSLECDRINIIEAYDKEELKNLKQLGKDAELVGFVGVGKGKEFVENIKNMEYKQAIYHIAKLSVDVGNTLNTERADGENVSDLMKFRADLTKFQNNMIEKLKVAEPEVFIKVAHLELSGKSLSLAEQLGERYESLGLGSKDDFINKIKSAYGNERLFVIDSLREKMSANIDKEDWELFNELENREFETDRKANETFIANIDELNDENNDKGKTYEDYEQDINNRKENDKGNDKENDMFNKGEKGEEKPKTGKKNPER